MMAGPPPIEDPHAAKAIQEIDAAMFSGDAFLDRNALEHLTWYMKRWERCIKSNTFDLDND